MRLFSVSSVLATVVLVFGTLPANAKTYYVSQSTGNDAWPGQAANADGKDGPWKTLAHASTKTYAAGDRILLKRGDTWNEVLRPKGSGTAENPVIIAAYDKGNRPLIDRQDFKKDLVGIHLADQEGYKIVGIEFAQCQTGIYAEYAPGSPNRKYLWIEDCYFHDSLLYQKYHNYPKQKIGLGICLFSHEKKNTIVASDITVKNCEFRRLASGIWTNSPDNFNKSKGNIYNFGNFVIEDCLFEEGYQWQLGMRGVDGGAVRRCVTHDIGRNFRAFNGVAGAMFARCKNWVFEDSEWGFISIGLGSGDGQAFDFESNCDHMVMRNCLLHDTDGAAMLLCCYASGPEAHKDIVMENCVLNGKCKRPIRPNNRCEIFNTTDWNEATWKNCRFYLSKGHALMHVADPEKDKRSTFVNCVVRNLSDACSTPNLAIKAKIAASTQAEGHEATKANDAKADSSWKATGPADQWIQLDFAEPTTINEFKIKEAADSSISRYVIECWDSKAGRWVGCFNGMDIGKEFMAPIVSRTTTKARLFIKQTAKDSPAIAEFEAFNDTTPGIPHNAGEKLLPRKTGEPKTKKTASDDPPFSFFAMDTGLRGPDVPDLKSKVNLLKKLGYTGIGYTYNPSELPNLLKLLDEQGLELSAIYLSPNIEDKLDPTLAETVKLLKGRRTRLEMALRSKKLKPSDPSGDKQAVSLLQELSDLVGESGPVVSVYPHTNFWAERVEDGVRLAQLAERKNVGTHFNLVHWKWVKQNKDLADLLKEARPHLFCVTINGLAGKQIVSLEKGDHDLDAFLALLKSVDFRGPVGVQGYSVPGPSADHLQRSMARWQEAMKKLQP